MKYYKVLDEHYCAKDGGKFDYRDYLPKGNDKGKWTPLIKDVNICNKGYHVTPYWNMWITDKSSTIFEVEVKNPVEDNRVGVVDKFVCGSFRIIRQIFPRSDDKSNTGDWNTGDRNTGYSNTGDRNTGNRNTGDRNTGDRNTGDRNTGYWNTGNRNTGNRNTGDRNTGDRNTGYRNTGDWNTGDWNTGDRNTGYRNTGDWNTGHRNTGCFNTKEPEYYELFNKPIKKDNYKKINFPQWLYFDLEKDYKKSFKKAFDKASKDEIQKTIELPNFDYKVFKEISGISKAMIKRKLEEIK